MRFLSRHRLIKRSLLLFAGAIFLLSVASLFYQFRREVRVATQVALAHTSRSASQSFPPVDAQHLTATQQRILALARQEYAKRPISYDSAVLRYTQGSEEAWCADFASWIYQQAGVPFSNPNSGSWRIPGVYTLAQYFKSVHRYKTVASYQPRPGDIAIYGHGQGHAAIVLSRHGNALTTIGGNESGRLRIDVRNETGHDSYDLLGYGVLTAS